MWGTLLSIANAGLGKPTVFLVLILSTTLGFIPATIDQQVVNRISFSERSDGLGTVLRIHLNATDVTFSAPIHHKDGTIEITILKSRIDSNCVLDSPLSPISSYRVDQKGENVSIQLKRAGTAVIASAYRDKNSNDLLVSLAANPSRETNQGPHVSARKATKPTGQPTAIANSNRWKLDTIVIDPGHGGKDSGALSGSGLKEKDVVLSVALKVGDYVKSKLNVNVVYTRNGDEFISLANRGHLANQAEGKLFVSIHANSARDPNAHGTETFFLGLHKTEAAKRVMDRENEVIRFEDDVTQYEDIETRLAVMKTLTQSAFMRQSQFLADLIEDQFENRVGRKNRGVKQAGFYVLYGASMPAVLIELGFLTNNNEASFMESSDGQEYLASAIFRAIRDFKLEHDKGLQFPSVSAK